MPADESLLTHVAEAREAVANLHELHERDARPVQRVIDQLTQQVARPGTLLLLLLLILAWLAANLLGPADRAMDPPPFAKLQIALGTASVLLTCMILTTQRHADTLAAHRAQLTLEMAILAEQKSAKTIALIEELRRDLPMLANRIDAAAEELSQPSDPIGAIEHLVHMAAKADGDA